MNDRGFSLIEALVAVVLTLGVSGAVFSFVHVDSYIAQTQPEALDMQQRARVGVDALLRDLAQAGAGATAGAEAGPLHRQLPPVVPRRLEAVPVMWGAIGGSAAVLLDVPTDYALLGAGMILAVVSLRPYLRTTTRSSPE